MRVIAAVLALSLLVPVAATAQKADTVFFENLTFDEIRDAIKGGATNVIIATGGTEDNGPHMVIGKHNVVVKYTAEKIARTLGNTLVAPIIAYVPEGDWSATTGHTTKPGTMSLPDDKGFTELLESASTSLKGAGFKNILLIGDSDGNQNGLKMVADKLTAQWKDAGVKVLYLGDYYTKSMADQTKYIVDNLKVTADKVGNHANVIETSELMFINSKLIRFDKLEPGNATNGATGDPTKATPQLGDALLKIKINNAVAQVRKLMGVNQE